MPVGFLPRLSIPAPGVERASGFLEPRFLQSDIYGFGIKTPYYRVLGPSADATLTPFVTTGGAALIEGEYRQRFANGGFDFWGVFAVDDGLGEGGGFGRGAFHTTGEFALPRDFAFDFDLAAASDDSFLTQFDYSDTDQLTSFARVRRTRANEYIGLGTIAFQSLTDVNESMDVPFVLPQFFYRRLRGYPGEDGPARHLAQLARHPARDRQQQLPRRRAGRLAARRRPCRTASSPRARRRRSSTSTRSGTTPTSPTASRCRPPPPLAGELRWPWVRHTGAADHVIEPIVQVVYVRALQDQDEIPNEDSRLPEFDETNLFAFNRFPGLDRLETGLRANLGHQLHPPGPRRLVGRPHARAHPARRPGRRVRRRHRPRRPLVGLRGRRLGRLRLGPDRDQPRALRHRPRLPPQRVRPRLRRRRSARCAPPTSTSPRTTPTPILGPQPETNEISLDARYRVRPNWELRGLWRYDVASHSNLRAGAGITYGNECAEFDLSVSRRYTSSDNVPPSTSIGFSLRLAGIGEKGQADWPARVCMREVLTGGLEGVCGCGGCSSFSLASLALAGPALAQNPYAPAIMVNEGVITHYDIDQRIRLLEALGANGDLRKLAVQQLTEDRVKVQAAANMEIELPEGAIEAGIEEFATGRGLTMDDVQLALDARGIDQQTLDDFVESGLLWRDVIGTRFRARAMPTEADLDAALEIAANTPQEMLTLAEIALPYAELGQPETDALAERIYRQAAGGASFAALAREYSRSGTAERGGVLDPIPATNLPPAFRTEVLLLRPGPGHPAAADLRRGRDHQARVDPAGRRRSRSTPTTPRCARRCASGSSPSASPASARATCRSCSATPSSSTDERPREPPVALTLGDPAGIGGEIALKAWAALGGSLALLPDRRPRPHGRPRRPPRRAGPRHRRPRRDAKAPPACRCCRTRCRDPPEPGRPHPENAAAVDRDHRPRRRARARAARRRRSAPTRSTRRRSWTAPASPSPATPNTSPTSPAPRCR